IAAYANALDVVRVGLLARADLDFEPVLARRQRTAPVLVVGAVRVVGAIEIEKIPAAAERLGLDVSPCAVRFVPARRIAERDEQGVALLVGDDAGLLIADAEPQAAGTQELAGAAIARLHRLDDPRRRRLEGDLEAVARILREVVQPGEAVTLIVGEWRVRARPEEAVLLVPQRGDVHLPALTLDKHATFRAGRDKGKRWNRERSVVGSSSPSPSAPSPWSRSSPSARGSRRPKRSRRLRRLRARPRRRSAPTRSTPRSRRDRAIHR